MPFIYESARPALTVDGVVFGLNDEDCLDNRNFRKKRLGMGILKEMNKNGTDTAHRAARLYPFNRKKYDRMMERSFNFEN